MKDSYVLPQETGAEGPIETSDDWVVIRRRSAQREMPEEFETVEEDPVSEMAQSAAPEPIGADLQSDAKTRLAPLSESELLGQETAVETGLSDPEDGFDTDGAEDILPDDPVVEALNLEAYEMLPAADDALVEMHTDDASFEETFAQLEIEQTAAEMSGLRPEPAPMPLVVTDDRVRHSDQHTEEIDPIAFWRALRAVEIGAQVEGKLARRGVPALIEYFRADPIAKGFDLLRTRLVRTIRAYGWRRIAVVSPTRHCGATFTAVNLALSLSRVPGSRTVLMDMNQRAPGVSEALGVRNPGRLDSFLSAQTPLEDYLVRVDDTLALGLADAPCDFAAEMLHDPLTGEVLDDMIESLDPNLILYDLPAMLDHDDLAAFLPQVDGVLLVVDGTQTTPEHISACERILEGQTQLLGVVLNRGRADQGADIAV